MAPFLPSFVIALFLCVQPILAKIVNYNWAITWVNANPDGQLVRPVIGINGAWPCPKLEASVGDMVVVNVQNLLGNESTSLHWHGIFQKGSAAMDGPVGVTQCGIPPGGNQTYSFKASPILYPNIKCADRPRLTNLVHTSITAMLVGNIQMDYEAQSLSMIPMPTSSTMIRL